MRISNLYNFRSDKLSRAGIIYTGLKEALPQYHLKASECE